MTDYDEVDNLHVWHRAAASLQAAVEAVLQDTSVDIAMVPRRTPDRGP